MDLKMDRWGNEKAILRWNMMELWSSAMSMCFFPPESNKTHMAIVVNPHSKVTAARPTRYPPASCRIFAFEPRWSTSSESHTPRHERNDRRLQNDRSPNGEARSVFSHLYDVTHALDEKDIQRAHGSPFKWIRYSEYMWTLKSCFVRCT